MNSTIRGAPPDSRFAEKEAEDGAGVGAGIGVGDGATVGVGEGTGGKVFSGAVAPCVEASEGLSVVEGETEVAAESGCEPRVWVRPGSPLSPPPQARAKAVSTDMRSTTTMRLMANPLRSSHQKPQPTHTFGYEFLAL